MGEQAKGSSLRELDSLADRLRLARQADKRPAVIVEGVKDRRLLARVCPELGLSIYIAGSRSKAISDCEDAVRLGVDRFACLVDRDFDDVLAAVQSAGLPIIAYDNADSEAMLWLSVTLDEVLDEIASAGKLAEFGGAAALRARASEVLRPVSRLRRANALHEWGVDFKSLKLESKIDKDGLELRIQPVCDSLWNADLDVSKRLLYETATDSRYDASCPMSGTELIRGRDALAVASAALRRLIGSLGQQAAAVSHLEQKLRLGATQAAVGGMAWRAQLEALVA